MELRNEESDVHDDLGMETSCRQISKPAHNPHDPLAKGTII